MKKIFLAVMLTLCISMQAQALDLSLLWAIYDNATLKPVNTYDVNPQKQQEEINANAVSEFKDLLEKSDIPEAKKTDLMAQMLASKDKGKFLYEYRSNNN